MRFRNRDSAAALIAQKLAHLKGSRPLVLGIPRGGVPMARIIADALEGDLDVVLVRKLGAPENPEFAIGSVSESGDVVVDPVAVELGVSREYIAREVDRQRRVMRERRETLAPLLSPVDPAGRTVIVVDDGVATGSTMLAALRVLRRRGPRRLIAATAVAPARTRDRLAEQADDVVCLDAPERFRAVGEFFDEFGQVTDEEVAATLRGARNREAAPAPAPTDGAQRAGRAEAERRTEVRIPVNGVEIEGEFVVPQGARGLVLFAHGSGSSRKSPRNNFVAERLRRRGLATLLTDLLTVEEDMVTRNRFDIDLLTGRLEAATRWVRSRPDAGSLPLGYFGASTGAACALRAAADLGDEIAAVVSRGGRPDLAGAQLTLVRAPTLLIVGGRDEVVIDLNRYALANLTCEKRIEIVSGATHLFEEPGTLECVAELAAEWFEVHLSASASRR